MRRLYIVLSLLFAVTVLYGQECTLEVTVSLEEDSPCISCPVQLIKLDSISLIGYDFTDSLGKVSFDTDLRKKEFLVRVSQYGYRDTIILASCKEEKSPMVWIQLTPLSLNIDEVTIIDQIALLKKSGDTTTFLLDAIETGSEISTLDIVQRLPGIEIAGNTISYHGKSLDEIHISDIDISDKNQVQLLQSIRYDLINQIQILENQNVDNALAIDSASLGMVMKVDLKKEAKGSMLYGIEGGLGYEHVYAAKPSAIYVGNNNGLRIEGTINNSYDNLLSFDTDLILNKVMLETTYISRYNNTYEHNTDDPLDIGSASTRIERQGIIIYSKNTRNGRFKSINTIENVLSEKLSSKQESFFIDDTPFSTSRRGDFDEMHLHSNTFLTLISPGKHSSKLGLPISARFNKNQYSLTSARESNGLSTLSSVDMNNLSLSPNYSVELKKGKMNYRLIGTVKYLNDNSTYDYASSDSLFYELLSDEDIKMFEQSSQTQKVNTENQLRISRDFKDIEVTFNSIVKSQHEELKLERLNLSNDAFAGFTNLDRFINDNALFVGYDRHKFRLLAGLKQYWLSQKLNDNSNSDFGLNPYMLVLYRVSQKWNISASYDYTTTLPDIYQLTRLQRFGGLLQIQSGLLPFTTQERRKSFNFSIFKNFETGENTTQFNLRTKYTMPYTVTMQQPEPTLTLLTTRWIAGKVKNESSLNLYYQIYRRKTIFNLRLNSMYRELELEQSDYGHLLTTATVTFTYKNKRFDSQSEIQISNSRTFNTSSSSFSNIAFVSNLSHEYRNFSQFVKLKTQGSVIGNSWRIRPIVSAGLKYKIPSANMEFSLIGANINNLRSNIIYGNTASLESISTYENALQPGNIMLFIKKLF